MNLLKSVLLSLTLCFFSTTSFSQKKVKSNIEERVESYNAKITSIDSSLALTGVQKEQITAIEVEKSEAVRIINKKGGDKKEIRETVQMLNKQIKNNVLTREQRKAFSKYNEKNKN